MTAEIVVVDYGMGNILSVRNALAKIGAEAVLSDDPEVLEAAVGVILPGVGGFPDCMRALEDAGLTDPLRRTIEGGVPYLGICLGLQILFEESEEFGATPGSGNPAWARAALSRGDDGKRRRAALEGSPHGLESAGVSQPIPDSRRRAGRGAFLFRSLLLCGALRSGAALDRGDVRFRRAVHRQRSSGEPLRHPVSPEKSGALGLGILRKFVDICGAHEASFA